MIKIGIVDDEPEIRKLLQRIVEKQEGCQVVFESGDMAGSILEYSRYQPEVVFVDIDLQGESGLECAKIMCQINPKVKIIFATAHSEYMANAFEIYAFDYLVKPFNVERVVHTLSRIKAQDREHFGEELISQAEHSDKLMIKGKEHILFLDKQDIIFVERTDSTTSIVTKEETYHTSVSLAKIEERLKTADFMRSHKSYIIHLSCITKIEPYGRWTYTVKFKGTEQSALMTAKSYEEIKKMFG